MVRSILGPKDEADETTRFHHAARRRGGRAAMLWPFGANAGTDGAASLLATADEVIE